MNFYLLGASILLNLFLLFKILQLRSEFKKSDRRNLTPEELEQLKARLRRIKSLAEEYH